MVLILTLILYNALKYRIFGRATYILELTKEIDAIKMVYVTRHRKYLFSFSDLMRNSDHLLIVASSSLSSSAVATGAMTLSSMAFDLNLL